MTTRPHTIELQPDACDLLAREARRRGLSPDQIVEEIVRTDLAASAADLDVVLRRRG